MKLEEFKKHFETSKAESFDYGISEPFSWRGSYDEVAFEILEDQMDKSEILRRINMAYTEQFHGYKGGEYRYNDYTEIHFECGHGSWSDGWYCANIIAEIEGSFYQDQEERLVKLAFNQTKDT